MLTDSIHDRALIESVHPPAWRNPQPQGRYNLVVLGGGTGGLVSAAVAAGLGARVALIERDKLGGDCLITGCVPSKALIRAGRLASEARGAASLARPHAAAPVPDFGVAMERMREIRARIAPNDSAARFRDLGVDVYLGEGRFVARDAIEVGGTRLSFARAVLATGARASAPPIPGLADAGFLTNESVFSLTQRPARIAVIGGGPIGCELAQTFARLGVAVTLFEVGSHVLEREDPDAAAIIQNALARDGVRLVLGASVLCVANSGASRSVRFTAGDAAESMLEVDEILVAAGRAPNVEGIGLEQAGVTFERQGIAVDDRLRTTNPRIYAVGDCCMAWKFTHAADAAAKIAVQNALFFGRKKLSTLVMPWCTYTDPELAHVGISAREAAQRGIPIDTYTVGLEHVDRAICDGEDEGFVRMHARKGTDRIAGATIVASHAGEMLSLVTAAMTAGIGLGKLAGTIFPYPTQSDAIKAASNQYMRTRLTPGVKRLFETFLRWRR